MQGSDTYMTEQNGIYWKDRVYRNLYVFFFIFFFVSLYLQTLY